MKQLAVRISRWGTGGWGIGMIALIPIPALASNQVPNAASVQPFTSQSVSQSSSQSAIDRNIDQNILWPAAQPDQLMAAVALSSRKLQLGDSGADVRVLQRYLSRNGLYPFTINGTYDQETADAVATYQRIRSLPATGIADEETLRDMDFDFLPEPAAPQQVSSGTRIGSRILRPGDSGTDVVALQRYLERIGLYTSTIDGDYGEGTTDAVSRYQRIRGVSDTGIANEETLRDMGFDFSSTSSPTASGTSQASGGSSLRSGGLSVGSSGSDVVALQQKLNAYGIPVGVDGDYGFATEQAVRTYQRVQGLSVTGVADQDTLDSMGFSVPNYPYVAAVVADESELANVQKYFKDAYIDRDRRGRFINIGNFGDRFPAEARVNAARARGFSTRVLYR